MIRFQKKIYDKSYIKIEFDTLRASKNQITKFTVCYAYLSFMW